MARRLIINGKSTAERIEAEYDRLLSADETVTVTEFARRVSIAYTTLVHRYPEWAEKVRVLRDGQGSARQIRSPATLKRVSVAEWHEAEGLINSLRREVNMLQRERSSLSSERDRWRKRAEELMQRETQNETLRGVVAELQRAVMRYADRAAAERILSSVDRYLAPPQDDPSQLATLKTSPVKARGIQGGVGVAGGMVVLEDSSN